MFCQNSACMQGHNVYINLYKLLVGKKFEHKKHNFDLLESISKYSTVEEQFCSTVILFNRVVFSFTGTENT
jgi:hypothetical protein